MKRIEGDRPWENLARKDITRAIRTLRAFSGKSDSDVDSFGNAIAYLEQQLEEFPPQPFSLASLFDKNDKKIDFEATHALGIEGSVISGTGWAVSHPAVDSDIQYEITDETNLYYPPSFWNDRGSLNLIASKNRREDTNIDLNVYKNSQGERRVKLTVCHRYTNGGTSYHRNVLEEWIAREHSSEGVDARVIIFHKGSERLKKFLKIRPSLRDNVLEVCEMTPVQIQKLEGV